MEGITLAVEKARLYFYRGVGGLFVVGFAITAFVWLYPIPDEAVALFTDRQLAASRSTSESDLIHMRTDPRQVSLLLKAHLVLMPAGRAKVYSLVKEAEFRRLAECAAAAPACTLTALEYQRYSVYLGD